MEAGVKFALVQMECFWGETGRNLRAMESFAREAGAEGAEVIVFPELTLTGIYKDDRVWELAENLDGPSVQAACGIARTLGLNLGFGFTERAEPLPYNTYVVATPDGSLAGVYRKNCIPHLEVQWWQGHSQRPVFTVGDKRIGVAICWDTTQEELLGDYGRQGADIVLMPHAWDADPLGSDGRDLQHNTMAELFEDHRSGRIAGWRGHDGMLEQFLRYIPARCRQNRFAGLFVNQCGQPHPALRIEGPTFAASRDGALLACTQHGGEQLLFVNIP